MPAEDYLIRHIQMIGQFIAQMRQARREGREDQAIRIGLQAVERLFGGRMDELTSLPLDQQCVRLAAGFSAGEARSRQFAYALLLKELGISYRDCGRPEVATASGKAALWICLQLLVTPAPGDDGMLDLARELLAGLPPEAVDAPLQELLAAVSERLGTAG